MQRGLGSSERMVDSDDEHAQSSIKSHLTRERCIKWSDAHSQSPHGRALHPSKRGGRGGGRGGPLGKGADCPSRQANETTSEEERRTF